MATFLEKAAHLVNHMFPLLCLFVVLVVSHLGFEDQKLFLIARVSGHCSQEDTTLPLRGGWWLSARVSDPLREVGV